MPPLKPIAAFFGRLVLIYALFMIPWPGITKAYAIAFCTTGNGLFSSFGREGRVYFRTIDGNLAANAGDDIAIRIENKRTRGGGPMELERTARKMGYLPTAFTVSLVLATPIPWRRRFGAAICGAALMSTYVAFQVSLHLLNFFSNADGLGQFVFAPWMKRGLAIAIKLLIVSPVTLYAVPVFVWIVVTFRRSDWGALLATPTAPDPAGAGGRKGRRLA